MPDEASDLAFITVGTTRFDELIEAVTHTRALDAFHRAGFRRLRIQYGRGAPPAAATAPPAGCAVRVEAFAFKPSLAADMDEAALVISHAGSGSILEALERGKTLVVVVNERLMDNHQAELADELHARRHLLACRVRGLHEVLDALAERPALEPFPSPSADAFGRYVDELMGVR